MFSLLLLVVGTVAQSYNYRSDRYQPEPSYGEPLYQPQQPSYDQYPQTYNDASYSQPETAQYLPVPYPYPYPEERRKQVKCSTLKSFNIEVKHRAEQTTARVTYVERNSRTYALITCPNDGNAYFLLGEKSGAFYDGFALPNVVPLAYGANAGILARCNDYNSYESDDILTRTTEKFRKVKCMRTNQDFQELMDSIDDVPKPVAKKMEHHSMEASVEKEPKRRPTNTLA